MTMPHLMNCRHSEEGWCLNCVKEIGEENIELRQQLESIQKTISDYLYKDINKKILNENS